VSSFWTYTYWNFRCDGAADARSAAKRQKLSSLLPQL